MRKTRVLVVDDDQLLRQLVTDQLLRSGFEASPAASGEEALVALQANDYDVVLMDIRMSGMSGLDALREIRRLDDPPEVIMLTADTSLGTGLEAMRFGAYDYLTKPATLDEMEALIRKADEKRRLVRQNAGLRAAVRTPQTDEALPALVYASEAMRGLFLQGLVLVNFNLNHRRILGIIISQFDNPPLPLCASKVCEQKVAGSFMLHCVTMRFKVGCQVSL